MARITAKRGSETREFNSNIWNKMPSHKYGWRAVVETPSEVLALKNKMQSQAPAPVIFTGEVTEETRKPVSEIVKLIAAAKTPDEVNTIVGPNEERVTVIRAAEHQLKQFEDANSNQ